MPTSLRDRLSGWLGTLTALLTCTGSMVATFAALTGMGAMGMGMTGMGMQHRVGQPMAAGHGLLGLIQTLSWPLLIVSVPLLLMGVRRASMPARLTVWAGLVLLVADQVLMKGLHVMVLWLYVPAMLLIISGNVIALLDAERLRAAMRTNPDGQATV